MSASRPSSAGATRRPVSLLTTFAVAGAGLAVFAILTEPAHGWAGVLVGAVFGVSIAIGGALFAAINIASAARWWRPVRGASIRVARLLWIPAIPLVLVLGLGTGSLYAWADEQVVASSHLIHGKTAWLNQPFFFARAVVILLVWWAFIAALGKHLRAARSRALVRTAIGFLVVFALTISVGFWDWTMSLEPEWYSTMHGVYGFAGCLQVGIAGVGLVALRERIAAKPARDFGSLLFAFSLFWGYIWFCEAMLIWYANIPEETVHFANRLSGGWSALFWLNPILNVVVPVVVLMSRHAKESRLVVAQVSIVIIIGHFLDILLLVGPAVGAADSVIPWAAIGAATAVAAAMWLVLQHADGRFLARAKVR